jgi:probable rRNA maturation factor
MPVLIERRARRDLDIEEFRRGLETALALFGRQDWEVSVVLGDDGLLRSLNRPWRGIDAPTDVLAFPQMTFARPNRLAAGDAPTLPPDAPADGLDAPAPPACLGDIVISVETAERQAAEIGHDLAAELLVLGVHGLCHLVGYDHVHEWQAAMMRREEARLLAAVGGRVEAGLVERSR